MTSSLHSFPTAEESRLATDKIVARRSHRDFQAEAMKDIEDKIFLAQVAGHYYTDGIYVDGNTVDVSKLVKLLKSYHYKVVPDPESKANLPIDNWISFVISW